MSFNALLIVLTLVSTPTDDREREASAMGLGGVMTTHLDLNAYRLYPNQGGDPNTYAVWNADDRWDFYAGGDYVLRLDDDYVLLGSATPLWMNNGHIRDIGGNLDLRSDTGFLLTDLAGTQGMLVDLATTDGVAYLTDEASGALTLYASTVGVDANSRLSSGLLYLGGAGPFITARTAGADLAVTTRSVSTAAATGGLLLFSADQTNAGDYDSGPVNIHSGTTNTLGESGPINIYSEVAGPGIASAGDINFAVNGAPGVGTTLLTLDASTQQALFSAGTASNPSIAFAADNGFYLIGAGRIGLSMAGSGVQADWSTTRLAMGTDITMGGKQIYDQLGDLNLGGTYAPTQGGVTGSVAIGSDAGNISLEVEGLSYFQDAAYFNGFLTQFSGTTKITDNYPLQVGSSADYWLKYISASTEFAFQSTDIDGIGTDGTVWSVQDGTDDVDFAGSVTKSDDTKGAQDGWYQDTQDLVFSAESSKSTTGTFIPDGARSISVVGRITTGFTGACASLDVGDSSTVNAFADAIALAQGTTFDTEDQQVTLTQELTGDEVTVTANGGTCSGTIRVVLSYFKPSAPTSN